MAGAADDEAFVKDLQDLQREFDSVSDYVESDFSGDQWNRKFVNMYTVVYNAATRPKVTQVHDHYKVQAQLYQFYHSLLQGYCHRYPIDLSSSNYPLYHDVTKRWAHYKVVKRWAEKQFGYLSRYYVPHCNVLPLEEVALQIFYNKVFDSVTSRIAMTILNLLDRERQGEEIDATEIQLGTDLFVKMSTVKQIYRDELAIPVIQTTAEHYKKKATLWMATDDSTTYLEKVENQLNAEQRRCQKYFLRQTETEIMAKTEYELLAVHQEALLTKQNSGFVSLIRDVRTDHLRRMYSLFERLPKGLDPMGKLLKDQCLADANEIIKRHDGQTETNFSGYVSDFIALHEKYLKILKNQLGNNAVFQKAMKDAFEAGLNQGLTADTARGAPAKIHCCELLANYCDLLIRGTEKLSEAELEVRFDGFVSLFSHVAEKDMFQQHSHRQLAKRLLTNVGNEEHEKMLITKLKENCGSSFTSHDEGMIHDRNRSQEKSAEFLAWCKEQNMSHHFDFTALVLTSGFWPKQQTDEVVLPEEVRAVYQLYNTHYNTWTKHRIITWNNSNATATILGRFNRDIIKEFHVTAFQACILLQFNHHEKVTAGQLMKELKLELDELKRVIPGFVKLKILLREGESAALKETDAFTCNVNFNSNQRKLKVPITQPRIHAAQSAAIRSVVEEDRKPAIDACIVRIMKSRKQLEHQALLTEIISQLSSKFQPDPKLIKVRIEELLSREFLERVADSNPSAYRYLA